MPYVLSWMNPYREIAKPHARAIENRVWLEMLRHGCACPAQAALPHPDTRCHLSHKLSANFSNQTGMMGQKI